MPTPAKETLAGVSFKDVKDRELCQRFYTAHCACPGTAMARWQCLAVRCILCTALLGLHPGVAEGQVLGGLLDRARHVALAALPQPRIRDFGAVLDAQHASRDAEVARQHSAMLSVAPDARPLASTSSSSSISAHQQNVSAAANQTDGAHTGQGALPGRRRTPCSWRHHALYVLLPVY
jgi:hypothetical protein